MSLSDATFWVALLQIIGVNIVLSGDNAVVIALAARSLPPQQRKQAVFWGSGAAVVMRIVLTIVAVELLRLPYLKLAGAGLLLWIGIQLLLPEGDEDGGTNEARSGMIAAVRTILIADLVMSLDNVIAVAAAAKGDLLLLILGLLISIPVVIFGSTMLMKVMERHPIIITVGGALLGWVAGEMAITDPAARAWIDANAAWLHYGAPVLGATLVVAVGKWMARRSAENEVDRPIVDLASASDQRGGRPAGVATQSRVLVAVDDSPASLRGIRHFIEDVRSRRESLAVDLLNVQTPVSRDVSNFVTEGEVKALHHDEGMKSIDPARVELERAGIGCAVHIGVGDFNHVVIHYAKTLGSAQVYLTETARNEDDNFEATAEHMNKHFKVPVALLR